MTIIGTPVLIITDRFYCWSAASVDFQPATCQDVGCSNSLALLFHMMLAIVTQSDHLYGARFK